MTKLCLLGAPAGDVIGSVYEFFEGFKEYDFPLFCEDSEFTDDTILTVAVADAILHGKSYLEAIHGYARRYPSSYGGHFAAWIRSANPQPYNSLGNGSAMRVSAVGWAFDSVERVLEEAKKTADVTHNHPEGVKGAQATALAVYMARKGSDKEAIKAEIIRRFGYDLSESVEEIRSWYAFDVTCPGTVPPAITAFLESTDFEDAIRKAISLGGDADTVAAITGSIAEAYYGGVPEGIAAELQQRLPPEFWGVIEEFSAKYLA